MMQPGVKAASAAATIAASGVAAAVNTWFSIAAGAATVVGAGVALYGLRQRGRIRRRHQPKPPDMPAALPLGRVSKEEYAQALAEWEIYRARRDQFDQDQKGQQ